MLIGNTEHENLKMDIYYSICKKRNISLKYLSCWGIIYLFIYFLVLGSFLLLTYYSFYDNNNLSSSVISRGHYFKIMMMHSDGNILNWKDPWTDQWKKWHVVSTLLCLCDSSVWKSRWIVQYMGEQWAFF